MKSHLLLGPTAEGFNSSPTEIAAGSNEVHPRFGHCCRGGCHCLSAKLGNQLWPLERTAEDGMGRVLFWWGETKINL